MVAGVLAEDGNTYFLLTPISQQATIWIPVLWRPHTLAPGESLLCMTTSAGGPFNIRASISYVDVPMVGGLASVAFRRGRRG